MTILENIIYWHEHIAILYTVCLNETLFFSATSFSALSFSFAAVAEKSIVILQQYMHHCSRKKYDLNTKVLIIIFLLTEL